MLDKVNIYSNKENPLVSICCITYNHENYIKQALDGFLKQNTNFCFEVLINDDASSDSTRSIIKEYARKYPEIFKPNFQSENQYSKGVRGMNRRFNFPRARGKFIALCEGDDYWIDENKLQKQVDLFNNNSDLSIIHTGYIVKNETKNIEEIHSKQIKDSCRSENYNYLYTGDARTLTCMFRKDKLDLISGILEKKELEKNPIGDRALFLLLSSVGKMEYLSDITGVYRLFNSESATRFRSPKKKYEFAKKCMEVELFLYRKIDIKDYNLVSKKKLQFFKYFLIARLFRFSFFENLYKYLYNISNKEYSNTGFY